MRALVLIPCIFLTGCATGTGAKWYAPTTWFSHAPAGKVDTAIAKDEAANAKVDTKTDEVVHAATRESHKAVLTSVQLPPSLSATTVHRFSTNSFNLLSQVSPLTSVEANEDEALLQGLLSNEQEKRTAAEAAQHKVEQANDQLSGQLEQARVDAKATASKLADAQAALRTSFDRENALANELRVSNWWSWFWRITIGTLFILALAGWIYIRFTLGGLPQAAGRMLTELRATNPTAGALATKIYDSYLNRSEQAAIASHSINLVPPTT